MSRFLDRFGFHQPPLNSVNHLHLHCLALPYTPRYQLIFMVTAYLSLSWMLYVDTWTCYFMSSDGDQ